jgi:adenylate cyclase
MKKKLWWIQLPVMVLFTFCFWVTELGVRGQLENAFFREKVYPVINRTSNFFTDLKFHFRGPQPPKNKIVVVEIDGYAIERIGRWPWHRNVMAALIDRILELNAKVVGLDMVFSEADPRISEELMELLKKKNLSGLAAQYETDPFLKDVIRRNSDRLVLGWTSDTECQPLYDEGCAAAVVDPQATSLFPPHYEKFAFEQFNQENGFYPNRTPMFSFVTPLTNINMYNEVAAHVGFFNANLDSDGYIRKTNLFVMAKGSPYPALALEMARIGLKEKLKVSIDKKQKVKEVGFINSGRTIPVTPLGVMQINFRGPSDVFLHMSAVDVLSENNLIQDERNVALHGKDKREVLKDAYVLIGSSALGVFDMRQFPFEANAAGVYGHAHILDNIISGDPLTTGTSGLGALGVVFVMLFGMSYFAYLIGRLNAVPALTVCLASVFLLCFLDFKLLFSRNYNWNTGFIYLELGTIFILTLAAKYVIEEKNKKFIRSAFAKYVPPTVVDSILKDPTKLSLGGEKKELTILFSDIRGFTTFSEKMDAKALASFLNDYLGTMTGLVFSNQGTLDKYIGDAIMAFWGAPLDQPLHAANACTAAIQMMEALYSHFERFKAQYGIEVHVGIGINSGIVNVGNMGSEQNFEYTVIGDHVNLASRLEGLTKKYGITIVTTRFTFDCIQSSGQSLTPHRTIDDVKVKGKKKTVELIQILDRPYPEEGLQLFSEGRRLYQHQKWQEAIQKFEGANRLISKAIGKDDGPCLVFLERCKDFEQNPPAQDWDGSWEMDSK